jgi:hypothetical protein
MLRSRLANIAKTLDEEIDPGIRNAAEEVARGAKSRVPKDTYALHDAIHVEKVGPGQYAVVAGDGKDVYYGHIVEGGSAAPGAPPARPFLMPAYEAMRVHIDDLVRAALKDI